MFKEKIRNTVRPVLVTASIKQKLVLCNLNFLYSFTL